MPLLIFSPSNFYYFLKNELKKTTITSQVSLKILPIFQIQSNKNNGQKHLCNISHKINNIHYYFYLFLNK